MYVGVGVAVERVHDLFDGWLVGSRGDLFDGCLGPRGEESCKFWASRSFPFHFLFLF